MQCSQFQEQPFSFGKQMHLDLPAIPFAGSATNEPTRFTARYERRYAVRLGLKTLGEFPHMGIFSPRIAFDMQQQQVLKRCDAVRPRGILRKSLESAHLIAKFGQLFESGLRYGTLIDSPHPPASLMHEKK